MSLESLVSSIFILMLVFIPVSALFWLIITYQDYKEIRSIAVENDDDLILKYEVCKSNFFCAFWVCLGLFWCIGLWGLILILD